MGSRARRFVAIIVSVAFVAGCAMPGGIQQEGSTTRVEPGGSPWKAWNIVGAMTKDVSIRLEDDFYAATVRDDILRRNEHPYGSTSVSIDRGHQIADQMFELLASNKVGSKGTQHDLECLRSLYDLYQNWKARDADGVEPIMPIVNRLRSIKTIDEYTEWLCSDDFRLSSQWYAAMPENVDSAGVSLFSLSFYNDVDNELGVSGSYVAEVSDPVLQLAPFEWDDEDILSGGKVDEEGLAQLRAASNSVDVAYRMLMHMGFSADEAAGIVTEAAALEALIYDGLGTEDSSYAMYSRDEFAAARKGGFPLDRIVDAYGYSDAGAYVVDDTKYLEQMDTVYVQENLDYLVSHALTSLALQSSVLLDSTAAEISYEANGDAYISDELLEAAERQEQGEGQSVGESASAQSEQDMTEEEYADSLRLDGMTYLQNAIPTSFAKVYVENYYDPSITEEVNSMVGRYVAAYEKMLMDEEWLSVETRQNAVEKLRAMRIQVGHPNKWAPTDTLKIASHDKGGSLFTQTRNLAAYDLEQELNMLRHPEEGEYWRDCMDVNAYYFAGTNSVTIGVGILGGVFWPKEGSFEQKLGAIGTIIGHEISHAFDSDGAYFDKNGKYNSWWTKEDLAAFEGRVQRVVECFDAIDPYGSGPYDGAQVCGEAIADLGGMKVTMRLAAEEKNFDYDAFFRAHAHSWASIWTPEELGELMLIDTHPLDSHRVNVPVREVDEFYKTYNIKEGDGMWLAPDQRISVW